MDWTVISTLICTIFGGSVVGGIMSLTLRKANKHKAEAEAKVAEAEAKIAEFSSFHNQIEELHSMLNFERDRNRELMGINIEKENRIQEKDRFIGEQTKRLRETQDREHRLQLTHNALIQQFKDEQCRKYGCPYREPENVYSKRAKLQIVGMAANADADFMKLPPNEAATIIDVEFKDCENDNTDNTTED